MKLFPGMSVSDLAAAAVASIGFAGWWLKYWPGHREKLRERCQHQIGELERLRVHLREDIKPWANEWGEDSHSHDWYNPGWHVRPFEWHPVESFNRVVMARDYPQELTAGLTRLEDAAKRFHTVLATQEAFRRRPPDTVLENLWPVVQASRGSGSALSAQAIAEAAPGLSFEGCGWLQDLYRGNREIHVVAIGRRGQADGLFETWRRAAEQIETTQRRLRAEGDPWWSWIGHVLAGIFGIVGLVFLIGLGWSLLDARRQSRPAALVPPHLDSASTSTQTDGVHALPADSQTVQGPITGLTPDQKELWSLDHPARIGCLVSSTTDQDSLIVMNSGYPVSKMSVDRLVFFDVQPYLRPGDARFVRYVVDDYYKDQLDGDYEGSQRVVYGFAPARGNLPLIHTISAGLQDSLTGRGFGWAGIEVGRAIRVVCWDMVGKRMEAHFWGADAAGQPPSHMKPIRRKEWEKLLAAADSVRKSGRTLKSGTTTRDADVQRVIRDCISAVTR